MEHNVFGCLEQHGLLVLAFFTPCKVVKLCLSEACINFKNISSVSRQLYPLAKTVYSRQAWSSFVAATQFETELSSSSPVLVNNIMGFKYDQIVKQTISELRGNKKKIKKNRNKCLFEINGTRLASHIDTYNKLPVFAKLTSIE